MIRINNQTTSKQNRKPVKTPATSAWYKGQRVNRLADNYEKAALVIRLIISTGIRTDELPHVTVEAVKKGLFELRFMNNIRKVTIPDDICKQILQYANDKGITSGPVFLTINGKPCEKDAMFHAFQKLAAAAGIEPERLTGDALRKYYNDKQTEKNSISTVQSSMGYKKVNYFVEYERQDEDTLLNNLEEMLTL